MTTVLPLNRTVPEHEYNQKLLVALLFVQSEHNLRSLPVELVDGYGWADSIPLLDD